MGTLFIVATPIGNLQDITLRALNVLENADFIAAEDTRKASVLINEYFKGKEAEMKNKLFSYYEQNELQKIPQVLNLLKNEKNVALISDAGTPAISDPGFKLIRECLKENIDVVSVPGPSSVTSALVSSGLPTDKFLFLGFPPQKPGHRIKFFQNVKKSQEIVSSTVIFFESPHKLLNTLKDVQSVFGNITITIARELTKIHEELKADTIDNFLTKYEKGKPKGEIIVLFNLK